MIKKNFLTVAALASVLLVGAGVGFATVDSTEVLASDKAVLDEVTAIANWNYAEGNEGQLLTNENNNYNVSLNVSDFNNGNGRKIEMNGIIQRIKSVTLKNDEGTVNAKVYPAYVENNNKDNLTWGKGVEFINNKVTFKESHYPAKVTIDCYDAKVESFSLEYVCNKKSEVFDAPIVTSGWYVVGEGSFLKEGSNKIWNTESGARVADYLSGGETVGTISLKKGDIFKVTNQNQGSWLNFNVHDDCFKNEVLGFVNGNAIALADCDLKLYCNAKDNKVYMTTTTKVAMGNVLYLVGSDGGNGFWEINQGFMMKKNSDGLFESPKITLHNDGSMVQVKQPDSQVHGGKLINGGFTDGIKAGTYIFTYDGKTITSKAA